MIRGMASHFSLTQDLNDLYYFVQIVDHGGFAAAGRALKVPKSRLSRRVALLESRLGVRLIQRSTRYFVVTEVGQAYYERCVAMLVEAEAAQDVVDQANSSPRGIVRLSCPTALLSYHTGAVLGRFLSECPRVTLEVESTNRQVDVLREGLDLAIRVRFPPLEDTDLVMKVLGESPQCLVASPVLFNRKGELPTLDNLDEWPSLGSRQASEGHCWDLTDADGTHIRIATQPHMVTDDRIALWHAARNGAGVAQLPCALVQKDLTDGTLVRILPGWGLPSAIVHAVFPSRRGLLPSVRALLDFLGREFAQNPA